MPRQALEKMILMKYQASLTSQWTTLSLSHFILKILYRFEAHRSGIVVLFCFAFVVDSFGQPESTYSISRSCLGASGVTQTVVTTKGNYNVSQSIGQASPIGTYHHDGYTVLQGYQQPFISSQRFKANDDQQLKVVAYPNPFHESISILFEEHIEGPVYICLSGMMGQVIHSRIYAASPSILVALTDIPKGMYVIKVEADGRRFLSKQIKQ